MRIFIESQCGLIDQLWSTALSPRCTPVLCGPRKCAASRDTQSVQIPPLLCTGGAASEDVEFWFALLEMIRIEHKITIESWKIGARHLLKQSLKMCFFHIFPEFSGECLSQPRQGCSLCSVRGLWKVSLRSTSQHLGCFRLGKSVQQDGPSYTIRNTTYFTWFYYVLLRSIQPFHAFPWNTKVAAKKVSAALSQAVPFPCRKNWGDDGERGALELAQEVKACTERLEPWAQRKIWSLLRLENVELQRMLQIAAVLQAEPGSWNQHKSADVFSKFPCFIDYISDSGTIWIHLDRFWD